MVIHLIKQSYQRKGLINTNLRPSKSLSKKAYSAIKTKSYQKPQKFIDSNIANYLFSETDENVCLYRAHSLETVMNDNLLDDFNLNSSCATEYSSVTSFCYNSLRFTDLEDSTKLYNNNYNESYGIGGIDNKVTCEF